MTNTYALAGKRVFVAGHAGMLGSAIVRRLAREDCEIVTASRCDLDLRDPDRVQAFFSERRPQAIFLAAAKVGGIFANDTEPADFLVDNLAIELAVIRAAFATQVEKLLFLGSTCIYPKLAPQPIAESALLSGPLEPTNEPYAIAKIAGVKLCEAFRKQYGCDYISAMPTNLYGPGDNYDLRTSHVLAALIAKAHAAKMKGNNALTVWGTGKPRREFLHSDDCADALVFLMCNWSRAEPINVGVGEDIEIGELAQLVAEIVGFDGAIEFDPSKPDGSPRKLVDVSKLNSLGWSATVPLRDGIASVYSDFLQSRTADGQ